MRAELRALGVQFASARNGSVAAPAPTGGGAGAARPAVVTYCTGGIRSGFLYMVLEWLDAEAPANYDGSWWEWSVKYST